MEAAAMMTSELPYLEEDNFRSMAERGVDRSYEELPKLRAELASSLRVMESHNRQDQLHAFTQLDRYESLESSAVNAIKTLAEHADVCRRGAAHFTGKEPALADALRGKAAWYDARRAEAVDIASCARGLREVCLRTVAKAVEEDILEVARVEYFALVAKNSVHTEFSDEAISDPLMHARPVVKRFVEGFAERAAKLRRAASELSRASDHAGVLRERA